MKHSNQIILVSGAASSGKSEWAENLALQTNKPVIYIATAQKNEQDKEWLAKIKKHQQRRPQNWQNWEISHNLSVAIHNAPVQTCLLIDSLGTWVANFLEENKENWAFIVEELLKTITETDKHIIFVAEETGWGIVPAYESGRIFRERLGELTRKIGSHSDIVYLVIAGYAINISNLGEKLPEKVVGL